METNAFECRDWTSSEFSNLLDDPLDLTSIMLKPRGIGFLPRAKFYADHVPRTVSRRPRTWSLCI